MRTFVVVWGLVTAGLAASASQSVRGASTDQAPPRPDPPPTGLILGRVVDAVTGRPIVNAIVTRWGHFPVEQPDAVLTDRDGRFVITGVPAGPCLLAATKSRYFEGSFGARRPRAHPEPLELKDGERRSDIDIRLWPHASISGRVVDEAGEPVVGVQVSAIPRKFVAGRPAIDTRESFSTATDDRGVFRVSGLMPGEYLVAMPISEDVAPLATVEEHNQPKNRDGDFAARFDNVRLPALPGSSRAIRVGDHVRAIDGRPIAAGSPNDAAAIAYPTTYAPGVTSYETARVIALRAGDEIENVDLALRPVPVVRVSGSVKGTDGSVAHLALFLMPVAEDWTTPLPIARTVSDARGQFTFMGVPAGAYRIEGLRALEAPHPSDSDVSFVAIGISSGSLSVHRGTESRIREAPTAEPRVEPMLWGTMPITVGDVDVRGVSVEVTTGARVSGRLVLPPRGPDDPPEDRTFDIRFERADGRRPAVTMGESHSGDGFGVAFAKPDGTFETPPLPPGRYLIRVRGNRGDPTFESALLGSRNLLETPLDLGGADVRGVVITLSNKVSRVVGVVRDASGAPAPQASVLAFPVSRTGWVDFGPTPWRIRGAATGPDGRFAIAGLPPGEYYLSATPDDIRPEEVHAGRLAELSRLAVRIAITAGEQKQQDLQMARAR
jgi:protocatechuate 3,4-dioxygenase beta subunit